jgi:hypothetical protein
MCRKLIYLISFVLVFGPILTNTTNAADLSLVGWWKFDEGSGNIANDSSSKGNNGTIYNTTSGLGPGSSVWVTDPDFGTVLSFNGDNSTGAYVSAGTIPPMSLTNDFTWAFWAKQDGDGTGNDDVIIGNRYGGTASPLQFIKFTPTKFEFYNNGLDGIDYDDIPGGVWIHHAIVKDGTSFTYYRNGVSSGTNTIARTVDPNPFFMGGDANGERWRGWLRDVRIYNRALSPAEIKQLGPPPQLKAWNPTPPDGAINKANKTSLRWSAGETAVGHDVYFGTSQTAVTNATLDSHE